MRIKQFLKSNFNARTFININLSDSFKGIPHKSKNKTKYLDIKTEHSEIPIK